MATLPTTRIYESTRIPSPVPTILEVDSEKHDLNEILTVNFGPNHPSTHGVLRLIVDLDGETVAGVRAVIGYLHTGFEKTMEHKTWWKSVTYPARIDYLSFQANELEYVLAIEKLLSIEVPRRATWARMALAELNRIHSHLVWLGTSALELGAISLFWYAFDDRDEVLDLFEMVGGARMHTRYVQPGGLAEDLPRGFTDEARKFCEAMPRSVDEYEALLDRNAIWLERTKGIGLLSADDALALGQSGPMLRGSGVDWDLRKCMPYLAYDEVDFDVIYTANGDVFDRYRIRLHEVFESIKIVRQCVERMPDGDFRVQDRKVTPPPRARIDESMEALIHHFKLFTEGFKVPAGETYAFAESPRGEVGCYLVSDGSGKPVRVHVRGASFYNLQSMGPMVRNSLVADAVAIISSIDPIMGDVDR